MDDLQPDAPSYPDGPPIAGPPVAGLPIAAPPLMAGPEWGPPPPPKRGRGWLIALGIVVVLFVGVVVACSWFGSLLRGAGSGALAGDAIALIHIDGVIAGTSGSLAGESVTPESLLNQLKEAEADDRVKAILLRVDSPGGTVAASEEIATEVARVDKPVIVSIGDVGASGAYMVSSQADWIVASPGSNVGSIGVILEVANLQGLLDKLGVKFAVITAGSYKDIGSPYRSLTPTETKLLQEQVDLVYEQFIDIVSKGRKMPNGEVRELATGMAWVGTQAKTYGLVDEIGTYNDAVDKAASLGKIRGTPDIIEYGRTPYVDLLDVLLGVSSKLGTISDALSAGAAVGTDSTTRPLSR